MITVSQANEIVLKLEESETRTQEILATIREKTEGLTIPQAFRVLTVLKYEIGKTLRQHFG